MYVVAWRTLRSLESVCQRENAGCAERDTGYSGSLKGRPVQDITRTDFPRSLSAGDVVNERAEETTWVGPVPNDREGPEAARSEAEQFRRDAEDARETRDRQREALETVRQERERLRETAETARADSEEARLAGLTLTAEIVGAAILALGEEAGR